MSSFGEDWSGGSDPVSGFPVLRPGDRCPDCEGAALVEFSAVIPMIDDFGHIVMPNNYGVCWTCLKTQYTKKYGFPPPNADRE